MLKYEETFYGRHTALKTGCSEENQNKKPRNVAISQKSAAFQNSIV